MESAGAPASSWPARHFDGRTAESRAAVVHVGADGLLIETRGDFVRWPFHELVLMRGDRAGEPVQLERRSQPVEVLVVDSPDFLRELRARLPRGARLEGDGAGVPAGRWLAGVAVTGVTLIFVLWSFGIPAFADFAAERMPPAWEASFGRSMLADLQATQRPRDEPAIRRPALLIRAALVPGAESDTTHHVVVLEDEQSNAFAIPGGHIVLTTGLLRALRSPDELAAVFAHEWGHVSHRHVLRSVFRQASLQVLLALIAGDQSAVSAGLRTAGELGRLSYSRGDEREADDASMALLAAHGASPEALASALEDIRGTAGAGDGTIGFLSTHPAPKERLERIHEKAARLSVSGVATWRDTSAWEAMKAALATKK